MIEKKISKALNNQKQKDYQYQQKAHHQNLRIYHLTRIVWKICKKKKKPL